VRNYRFSVLAVNIRTQPPLCIVAQLFFHIQWLRSAEKVAVQLL